MPDLTTDYRSIYIFCHLDFNCVCNVFFKKITFLPSTHEAIYIPESVFKRLRLSEQIVYVWTEGENGRKELRFQKYPSPCGRGLRLPVKWLKKSISCLNNETNEVT